MTGSFDLLAVFDAFSGPFLLLSPALRIEAVSDAYLAATLTTREHLLGQYMFDAFPDNPATPEAQAAANLRASLQQVLATGQPHQMALQHYDVPDLTTPGGFVERYWEPVNTPLLDAHGVVKGIIHHVVNVTDHVRTEAHLRESQAREQAALAQAQAERATLQHTLEQTPVAIAILEGADYVVTFANEGMRLLWGRPLAPLLGRPHFEALPDLAGQGFEAVFANAYHHGQPTYLHEQPVQIDRIGTGQLIPGYFNIVYQPLRDGQNRITGIVASATEVTEQVQARQQVQTLNEELAAINEELAATNEELQASNEEYLLANVALAVTQQQLQQLNAELEGRVQERTREAQTARQEAERQRGELQRVFEQAPVALFVLHGPTYIMQVANPPMSEMLGYPTTELLGRPYFEAVPELATQGYPELLAQVWHTGQPVTMQENPARFAWHQPGEIGYFTFVYQPIFDAAGYITDIMCVAVDVTEQVQARQAAEASARQLRLITDALPVLIAYLDRDQRYQFANKAYEPWFNLEPAELLGRPIREVAGEQAYPNIQPYILRALAGESVEFEAEMPSRPDFTRHIRTSYIPDVQQGEVQGFYTLVTDVTEPVLARRQVQALNEELAAINEELTASNEELQLTNRQLTRTNVDLDTFVYTASHDLKAPISNIEGLVAALRETLPAAAQQDEVVTQLLGLLDTTVSRFLTTITQLTDVSRLQRAFDEPVEELTLAPLVADVLADLAPVVRAAGGGAGFVCPGQPAQHCLQSAQQCGEVPRPRPPGPGVAARRAAAGRGGAHGAG